MAAPSYFDQITDRVDRLLLRHEELRRTNAILSQQVHALTQERDLLQTRFTVARQRIDALLARLPQDDTQEPRE
jgi:cell division protein ZapB